MDLKPLPFEPPSRETGTKSPGKKKNVPRQKINQRINSSPGNSASEKLLKDGCRKILGYLDCKKKNSLAKISDLEKTLYRVILTLQKRKRDISGKKWQKKQSTRHR